MRVTVALQRGMGIAMRDPGPISSAPVEAAPIPFREFVALVAAMMALTALSIDSMLPALPAIGASLGVEDANQWQFVITAFMLGFGGAQLVLGPLSDRYGRRPVLTAGLIVAVIANLACALAGSFELLLAARFLSGTGVAAARVVTIAVVRDCYSGRAMARVMSLAFMVFMIVPVLAPTFGQLLLVVGPWPWIFAGIATIAALVLAWFLGRLPETLPVERRAEIHPSRLVAAWRTVLSDRYSVGYTLAAMLLQGGMFGFLGSVQQIVFDVFDRPRSLPAVFAGIASAMAAASFFNSRIVMALGTRLISHAALMMFVALAALHLLVAWAGLESFWTFVVLQALMMGCFGLCGANFSSMAMERMGDIAGTAASLQGFAAVIGGALIGAAIGLAFDGTTVPLYAGFLTVGVISVLVIWLTEHRRLFRRG